MLLLLCALAAASLIAPLLIRVLGRPAFAVLALVPAAGFVWVANLFFHHGFDLSVTYPWVPSAHLNIEFRLDPLSGLFSLIILGIGALVLLYCWGYFDSAPKRLRIFGAQLSGFAFAMYGLVISDNIVLMYVFWEVTSILSYLLVGYYAERASSRRAATVALMVTTLGGLAMLVGIIVFGQSTGVWTLSALSGSFDPDSPAIAVAAVLILAGALSKSAIVPTHFWLPGAMAAPTPVSAYLHSAAMVKAGIYLIARLSPDFAAVPLWHLVVLPLGALSMVMSGWMALRQKDLKLILAYGTLSQLGFIVCLVGIGSPAALVAGLALTFAHSLFKATLFMVVGIIDRATGTRDCRKLSGIGRQKPLLAVVATIAACSMAGVFPLIGFVAKETALGVLTDEPSLHGMPGTMLLVTVVGGSVLTVAYSLYFLHGAFAVKAERSTDIRPIPVEILLSPLTLGVLCIVVGLQPWLIGHPIDSAVHSELHLALWHGLSVELLLSLVIITGGVVLFWQRRIVAKLHFTKPALGDANRAYDVVVASLRWASLRLTASTQRGSLIISLATIFVVFSVLPGIVLLLGPRTNVRMELWDSPLQAVAAAIIVVMAIATTVTRNRLSALIFVGVCGYGVAFVFATYGAPDLALTQLLVETLTVVVFMLVMRRFPTTIDTPVMPDAPRLRAWLSILVGVMVSCFAVFAMNARGTVPIAVAIPELAHTTGHGLNAVNVLLVDIRAWDTFGEISVLVITAIGVTSLIYRTRSFYRPSKRPTLKARGRRWLAVDTAAGSPTSLRSRENIRNRSLLVDVLTRLLFPSMLVLSLYFFFSGHNGPGGGFAGGLVAGLAIVLRYLAGGKAELEATIPIDASKLLGCGLLLSAGCAFIPLLFSDPVLRSYYVALELGALGKVSLSSVLIFDAGVYLIVVGVVLRILDSTGTQLDIDEEIRKQRARDRARHLRRKAQRASMKEG